MKDYKHSRWSCKYHVVWIPKYRKKVIYGQLRKENKRLKMEREILKKAAVFFAKEMS
jgi:putative transposase